MKRIIYLIYLIVMIFYIGLLIKFIDFENGHYLEDLIKVTFLATIPAIILALIETYLNRKKDETI